MDEGIWEAARSVRPYLVELVGPAVALAVDAELSELLTCTTGDEDIEHRLREVLDAREGTSVFLERVLDDLPVFRPPRVVAAETTRFGGLPGQPLPVPADKFRCPQGDYVWYRPEVGVPVPQCPTHGSPLASA
ncbi:hypothetical protein O4328_29155 [Rhodococcus opacus]|uniref:DUF222 domain-containing protein n=1 Tax=Rhodococcus opacus TaxID=37919 RepID=A0AAX3YT96_RHOOP|nr:hypothetical protein [Rhodococcus opacus]MCZ4587711.1 hypothetical protein [Rhodococcus opacus]WLF51294.1 hypothetical protein Q5707_38685 [Rhodococcus opacus]